MCNFEVESKEIVNIWGRSCEINIIFDCFEDEEIDEVQKEAYIDFKNNWNDMMNKSYIEFEKYCITNYSEQIMDKNFDNIFKYIVPKTLYIQKNKNDQKIIGFICYFKFDMENNIAIKFVNCVPVEVGGEQIVL